MLKKLKKMFYKKELRLRKLELEVLELQLQVENFENEGNVNIDSAKLSQFDKTVK